MSDLSPEEELQEVSDIMKLMIYNLSIIGVMVEDTKVPITTNDKEIEYMISVPEKFGDDSDKDIALKAKAIIINALEKCDINKDNVLVKYATRYGDTWDEDKANAMIDLLHKEPDNDSN